MDFSKSMAVAASGMRAQTDRMKTIAENIANANSTSPTAFLRRFLKRLSRSKTSFRPANFGSVVTIALCQSSLLTAKRPAISTMPFWCVIYPTAISNCTCTLPTWRTT